MKPEKVIDRALCVLFPRRCDYCGRVIEPQFHVCDECKDNLPVIESPVCLLCGHSKADCVCKARKSFYKAVVAPFYYEDAVRTAIDRMKFQGHEFICSTMARDMAAAVRTHYCDIEFDYITYVPFSKENANTRDFNHSELIAREIGKLLGVECVDLLEQLYEVPTQHTLNSSERMGNVFGIYDVKATQALTDKTILLVDDIKTTGSTLNECAKMLHLAGSGNVYCVAFAITKHQTGK